MKNTPRSCTRHGIIPELMKSRNLIMKLPSNDNNTGQEQRGLPIRAKVRQYTKAPIRYVIDTPQQIINCIIGS
jgi:hypothetical protein